MIHQAIHDPSANPFRSAALCALSLLAAAALAAPASADISSGFDADSEGWTDFQNTSVTWFATGGAPDGYIQVLDTGNSWGYVEAPPAFLAELTYPGLLSFDLRAFTSSPGSYPIRYDVRVGIEGDGLVLLNELVLPDGVWRPYDFYLYELAGWRIQSNLNQNYNPSAPIPTAAELEGVLLNATRLVIATDYNNGTTAQGVNDETHIDNVFVPEPAFATGLLLGSAGCAGAARARRRQGSRICAILRPRWRFPHSSSTSTAP